MNYSEAGLIISLACNLGLSLLLLNSQDPPDEATISEEQAQSSQNSRQLRNKWTRSDRKSSKGLQDHEFVEDEAFEVDWEVAKKLPINYAGVWDNEGGVTSEMVGLLDLTETQVALLNSVVEKLEEDFQQYESGISERVVDANGKLWTHLKYNGKKVNHLILSAKKDIEYEFGNRANVIIDLYRRYHPSVMPYKYGQDHMVRFEVIDKQELVFVKSFDSNDPDNSNEEAYFSTSNHFLRLNHLK